ncbi:S-adenosyl-L-methionine-dependent methyltransferase [Xylariaceae sp. FL1019]|nr:S-adenosyl-L-methionine-dependent methyltransferase [Xylariaceae sp. FL1019]
MHKELQRTHDASSLAQELENLLNDPSFNPELLDLYGWLTFLWPIQLSLAKIGHDTGLFDILTDLEGRSITHIELARRTQVNPSLMSRLLRYYQSFDMISQPDDDEFTANNVTRALVKPGGKSGVEWNFTAVNPTLTALPQFLRENPSTDLSDISSIPWYMAHDTPDPVFKWINERPDVLASFAGWMVGQRDGLPSFLDVLDFEEEFAQGVSDDDTVFVDIGGSMGHQCVALRKKCPKLMGKVVLQDLPETIEKVKREPLDGFVDIETRAYDFFTPQLLKGARTYYLRNVLHDWPDSKCVEILRNIIPAMESSSHILIDEMILPSRGAPWRATQQDLIMATVVAAKERSREEWLDLFDRAGLEVKSVWRYTEELSDCLIVLVPK